MWRYSDGVYIATVIPISRGIPFDTLTYYVGEILRPGTLVSIPLGKQTIYGLVTESIPLTEAKAFVKRAAFSLKKVRQIFGHIPYFESVTNALKDTGIATISPVGTVAASVIPNSLFEYISLEKIPALFGDTENSLELLDERTALGPRVDRLDTYKRLIRSSFAEKKSVLFIAPTIRALSAWHAELSKGIARHAIIFNSKVNKKTLRSQFSLLKQEGVPLVVFATPNFSVLPISKLGTLIVEDESSALYKSNDRYEIDARIFFKQFAMHAKVNLVWGDTLPRFETLKRTNSEHLPRPFVPEKLHIVPVDPYRTVLPSEVIELVRHAEKKKRRLFIYTNRKGVAPLSRCADCGTIVECPQCSLPMALRNRTKNGERERFFVCLHCTATLDATYTCKLCGSWNIIPVSIGTESIRDAVVQIVGPEPVVIIDDDFTPDDKSIEVTLDGLQNQKFCVVIGTQKALPYIKKIHYAMIPFFDRLLSTPSMYTTEQILRLVMECNEAVSDGVLAFTKNPDFSLTKNLETQKINLIVSNELDLRKQLGYPPFGTLLKISLTVPEGYSKEIRESVHEYVQDLDIAELPARRISMGSMKVLLSWLIKVSDDYIEEEGQTLSAFLESLRFPYKIEQNPERL